jgi:glycine betaine/proline transport system substrate-binding protein
MAPRRRRAGVTPVLAVLAALTLLATPLRGRAAQMPATDPAACQRVRRSDIGWTDLTATPALFSALLPHLRR